MNRAVEDNSIKPYTVLLVEDEIAIREGIRDVIEWEKIGYRFIGEARNGEEALNLYYQHHPDLVITDIRMPKMDGLDLIAAIRRRSKETKILILTGFEEFAYARMALKFDVRDYLLKPVAPHELSELVAQIKSELDDLAIAKEYSMSRVYSLESRNIRRRMTMLKMIFGISSLKIHDAYCLDDALIASATYFRIVVYDFDHVHRSINPDKYRDIFQHCNPSAIYSELIPDPSGTLIECLFFAGNNTSITDISDLIDRKRELILLETQLSVSAGIGRAIHDFSDIQVSYETARDALESRYIHGGGANYDAMSIHINYIYKGENNAILKLLKSVESSAVDEWDKGLDYIIEELKKSSASKEQCQEIITLVISAMLNKLRQLVPDFNAEDGKNSLFIQKANSYKTLDKLHSWLKDLVSELISVLKVRRLDSSFSLAEKARQYIETHYMYSSLAVEDLCDNLGVSQSTLSRLFKNYLDTNFSALLCEVRIMAAKRLIQQTDLRNKEIAYQIGYNSPQYFSHVFTKNIGYSPSEFRRKNHNS